jgi:hypothetical protein
MLGQVRGHCRDHRPLGHPALPGLSGPFHTRATHRPRTTGPAAGPPTLTRLPRGVLGSDITPLGPHRIPVLVFRAGTAIRRLAGTNTSAYPSSGWKGASERRSLPRFGPDSAAEMTSMRRPLSSRLDASFSPLSPWRPALGFWNRVSTMLPFALLLAFIEAGAR